MRSVTADTNKDLFPGSNQNAGLIQDVLEELLDKADPVRVNLIAITLPFLFSSPILSVTMPCAFSYGSF